MRHEVAELLRANWAPGIRLLVGLAGAGLVGYGLARRGLVGALLAGAGATALLRATTNLELAPLLGIGAPGRGIHVRKSIHVGVPPEEAYAFFSRFEEMPRFMEHVRDVQRAATAAGSSGSPGRAAWSSSGRGS